MAIVDKYGTNWNREELILALNAYCQIPFAKTKASNPEVISLATLLGRTPGSVARKLGNFGAFDPTLAQKGISGLIHVGKTDKIIWDEFYGNWESLVRESQHIKKKLGQKIDNRTINNQPLGETERQITTRQRIYQDFFRRSILASYESMCCVCQCDLSSLLIASHIIPWAVDKKNRINPEKGLCLCLLHDGAFDRGLLTISDALIIRIAREVKHSRSVFVQQTIVKYDNHAIFKPRRFLPRKDFLEWHENNIFKQ